MGRGSRSSDEQSATTRASDQQRTLISTQSGQLIAPRLEDHFVLRLGLLSLLLERHLVLGVDALPARAQGLAYLAQGQPRGLAQHHRPCLLRREHVTVWGVVFGVRGTEGQKWRGCGLGLEAPSSKLKVSNFGLKVWG